MNLAEIYICLTCLVQLGEIIEGDTASWESTIEATRLHLEQNPQHLVGRRLANPEYQPPA